MMRDPDAEACRQVWLSVLSQVMRDLFAPSGNNEPVYRGATGRALLRREAESWIGSRDFYRVCALAGLDGTKVEARVRARLAEQAAGDFDFSTVDPWQQAGKRFRGARVWEAA